MNIPFEQFLWIQNATTQDINKVIVPQIKEYLKNDNVEIHTIPSDYTSTLIVVTAGRDYPIFKCMTTTMMDGALRYIKNKNYFEYNCGLKNLGIVITNIYTNTVLNKYKAIDYHGVDLLLDVISDIQSQRLLTNPRLIAQKIKLMELSKHCKFFEKTNMHHIEFRSSTNEYVIILPGFKYTACVYDTKVSWQLDPIIEALDLMGVLDNIINKLERQVLINV